MSPNRRNASRLAGLAAVAVALLVVGCAAASSPQAPSGPVVLATLDPALIPSRPPVPSHSPSPRPTVTPQPTPSPTPAAPKTAIEKLKIGSPYTLVDNPANPALTLSLTIDVAGRSVKESIDGREVRQRGTLIGLAYTLSIEGYPMNEAGFEAAARGGAASSAGQLIYGTVLGHRVAYVAAKTTSAAMFLAGDHLVMVVAPSMATTKTLLQSLIKANF